MEFDLAGFQHAESQKILNKMFQAMSTGMHVAEHFALAVVHGDDGKGAFWYTSPNDPNLLSEPLADTLRHAVDDHDPQDDGSTPPSSASPFPA